MNTAEKIYIAREKWKLSFESLAFIFEIPKEEVKEIYEIERHRKAKKKLSTITWNSELENLIGVCLSLRVHNLIYRKFNKPLWTIKDFLRLNKDLVISFGEKTAEEIFEAQDWIRAHIRAK